MKFGLKTGLKGLDRKLSFCASSFLPVERIFSAPELLKLSSSVKPHRTQSRLFPVNVQVLCFEVRTMYGDWRRVTGTLILPAPATNAPAVKAPIEKVKGRRLLSPLADPFISDHHGNSSSSSSIDIDGRWDSDSTTSKSGIDIGDIEGAEGDAGDVVGRSLLAADAVVARTSAFKVALSSKAAPNTGTWTGIRCGPIPCKFHECTVYLCDLFYRREFFSATAAAAPSHPFGRVHTAPQTTHTLCG